MKRSAKERQKRMRAEARADQAKKQVAGVIAVVDDAGMIELGPDTKMPAELFLEGARKAARISGAKVRLEGRQVIFEGLQVTIPNAAVSNPPASIGSGPLEFESHPFFSARAEVAGFEAFYTRGPEEPVRASSEAKLVSCRGALFVRLTDREHPWYSRSYAVSYAQGAPEGIIARAWQRQEEAAKSAAAAKLLDASSTQPR